MTHHKEIVSFTKRSDKIESNICFRTLRKFSEFVVVQVRTISTSESWRQRTHYQLKNIPSDVNSACSQYLLKSDRTHGRGKRIIVRVLTRLHKLEVLKTKRSGNSPVFVPEEIN
jgi:hypothetical protein